MSRSSGDVLRMRPVTWQKLAKAMHQRLARLKGPPWLRSMLNPRSDLDFLHSSDLRKDGGRLAEATDLISVALESRAYTPRLPTAILKQLAAGKQSHVAVRLLSWMPLSPVRCLDVVPLRRESSLEVNSYHSSATVSACASSKHWQLALSLLDSEVTEVSAWDTMCFQRNCFESGFNAALDACLKARQWHRCLRMFQEMSSRSLEGDAISSSIAIVAAASANAWQLGLSFYFGRSSDEIADTAYLNALRSWQIALSCFERFPTANLVTYNSVLNSCSKSWPVAHELMRLMPLQRLRADGFTYCALLSGPWQMALRVPRSDQVSCHACLDRLQGQWAIALELLAAAGAAGYTSVAQSCGSARWRRVEELFVAMERRQAVEFRAFLVAQSEVQSDLFAQNTVLSLAEDRWQRGFSYLLKLRTGYEVGRSTFRAEIEPGP